MTLAPHRQRAAAYAVTALFALAYMGNGGEFCSLLDGECPGRLSAVIAMGVLTFVSGAALAALVALDKVPRAVEAGLAGLTALLNTCGMAVVASPRSYTNSVGSVQIAILAQASLVPALLFSIVAEVAAVLALFLALSDDFDAAPAAKTVDPPVPGALPPAPAPAPQQHVPAPQHAPVPVPVPVQTMPPPVPAAAPPV